MNALPVPSRTAARAAMRSPDFITATVRFNSAILASAAARSATKLRVLISHRGEAVEARDRRGRSVAGRPARARGMPHLG